MLVDQVGFEPTRLSSRIYSPVSQPIAQLIQNTGGRHCLMSSEHCTLLRCSRLPVEPLML